MSKFLVTGGAGFIGSYVVDRLIDDEHEVVIFDHVSNHEIHPEAELFLGDIRDEVAVTEAFAHVDGFIHLAGVLGTQETIQNPKPAIMTNITAGLNVLEAASQYSLPGVNIAVGNYWESNPYSISKSTVERLVKMYNAYRGTNVSVVRALNAYGPRQSVAEPYGTSKVRKIMPSFIMKALHGHTIQIYGDGDQIMDMIYVEDVANFLVDALYDTIDDGKPLDGVVEAGTGRSTTVKEIAETVQMVANTHNDGPVYIEHLPLRPGETAGAIVKADTDTQDQLYPGGYDFITLEQGIIETYEYYRAQVK